ncbi:hypothetical protein T484DRAFT_1797914 [Baffinella frigidus]|nr:hypothetical protein T484DRAFT_1797914 [Cryptophyta sp. CCMP2293]
MQVDALVTGDPVEYWDEDGVWQAGEFLYVELDESRGGGACNVGVELATGGTIAVEQGRLRGAPRPNSQAPIWLQESTSPFSLPYSPVFPAGSEAGGSEKGCSEAGGGERGGGSVEEGGSAEGSSSVEVEESQGEVSSSTPAATAAATAAASNEGRAWSGGRVDLRAATSGTTADDAPEEAGANDSLAAPPPSSRAGAAAGEREAPLAQEPRARGVVRCCDADGRETAETVELPLDGWGMDFQWRAPPPVSAVSEARGSEKGGGSEQGGSEKGGGSAEGGGSVEGGSEDGANDSLAPRPHPTPVSADPSSPPGDQASFDNDARGRTPACVPRSVLKKGGGGATPGQPGQPRNVRFATSEPPSSREEVTPSPEDRRQLREHLRHDDARQQILRHQASSGRAALTPGPKRQERAEEAEGEEWGGGGEEVERKEEEITASIELWLQRGRQGLRELGVRDPRQAPSVHEEAAASRSGSRRGGSLDRQDWDSKASSVTKWLENVDVSLPDIAPFLPGHEAGAAGQTEADVREGRFSELGGLVAATLLL